MTKPKTIALKTALDAMRSGSTLMLLHDNTSASGLCYCVVPGGRVGDKDAAFIIRRDDVVSSGDGLFPDTPQTWKLLHFIK